MLLFTITFGGLLMMGHQARGESLFYYFKLEDQVPENHLLRLIDRHVNFEFIRARLRDRYSDAGRPSIDPELLLRMLLGFDQEILHHSTFSKNRHGRFQESNLFQELFEEIVARCMVAGLVKGQHMSVDGSFIRAIRAQFTSLPTG